MSGKRKLTSAEREFIIDQVTRRRDIQRTLRRYPTNAELADEFGVSERRITSIVQSGARVRVKIVPHGTKNSSDTSLRRNNPE